jgi:RNA polymerase sigma-70 factor (ECF subfamily)
MYDEAGIKASFDTICRENRARLTSYATRLLGDSAAAEDVVQETFLRAWTRIETFDADRDPAPWLYTVARNLCIETMRARNKCITVEELPESEHDQDPAAPLERAHERHTVRRALASLTSRHREVLVLRDVEGMEYEHLAARLGVSEPTARAVLFRARKSLREQIQRAGVAIVVLWAAIRARAASIGRRAGDVLRAADATGALVLQAGASLVVATVLGMAPVTAGAVASHAREASTTVKAISLDAAAAASAPAPNAPAASPGSIAGRVARAASVRADRRGNLGADANVPGPNGEDGHVWMKVWRDHGTDNSTVLTTLDHGSDAACAAAGGACDTLDTQLASKGQ